MEENADQIEFNLDVHNEDNDDNDDENDDNDDDMIADDDSANNNQDDVIDGGVASESLGQIQASECPVVLYIQCQEDFSSSIVAGSTISIGLEKTTKLSAVFERFCTFLNTYKCKPNEGNHDPCDFEFVHCSILNPSDTVETAALMKEDKIKVQRNQEKERREKAFFAQECRNSDSQYFQQLRTLLPQRNPSALKTDVVFHCKGKIKDEQGYKQAVLSTCVRGHSAMVMRRCNWLARKIEDSKLTKSIINQPQKRSINHNIVAIDESSSSDAVHISDGVWQNNANIRINNSQDSMNIANEVEQDDDEDINHTGGAIENENSSHIDINTHHGMRSTSPVISFVEGTNCNPKYEVTLKHPPEAVKLLLEYCYTNRVIPLGYLAFKTSFKPVDENMVSKELRDYVGPVEPKSWPYEGRPTVSFNLALAGIRLAEEANLPRFSLMCEIAASQLVSTSTSLEALALCEEQRKQTGNKLIHLRKAVMLYHILGHGSKGVNDLSNMSSFNRTLLEKRDVVVPSLLMGVKETINQDEIPFVNLDDYKNASIQRVYTHFSKVDDDDKQKRESERMSRRKERWNKRSRKRRNPYRLETKNKEVTQIILSDEVEFGSAFDNDLRRIDIYEGKETYQRYSSSDGNNIFDFSHHGGSGKSSSGNRRYGRNSVRIPSRRKRRK